MEKKSLIYFCQGIESVFDSQVLELLIFFNENKTFERIFLFLGIRDQEEENKFYNRKIPKGIDVILYKAYPNYSLFNPLIRSSLSNLIEKNKTLLDKSILHVREEIVAWHLINILNKKYHKKILPDIRGANLEEIFENKYILPLQRHFKMINYRRALMGLNNFEGITVVSKALKKYLIKNFNIKENKIFITPDLAGQNFSFNEIYRKKLRSELKISTNENLLVFSNGSTTEWQNWQNNDIIKSLAEKGIKILNLSQKRIEHKNVINKFIPYDEVPKYLNAADIAIIWGDKRIVTEVRSPVKFSEYICCGLPIIANDSVDVITEYLKNTGFGILLNNLDELEQEKINMLRLIDRNKISTNGIRWLGIDSISSAYSKLYSLLD